MTAHDCRTFDPHCFRCDLSRQEASLARDPDDLTLYRPVLIESTEQAEALPVGTLARHDDHMPVEKWETTYGETHWGDAEDGLTDVDMVGWTALVPIEAEEETREHPRRHEKAPRAGEAYLRPATMTRLVTPWEET